MSERVTVIVPNPDARILPGMYATARLDARRFPDRILVPRQAVVERYRRQLVFLFEGEGDAGTAMWQYVSTGLDNGTYVEQACVFFLPKGMELVVLANSPFCTPNMGFMNQLLDVIEDSITLRLLTLTAGAASVVALAALLRSSRTRIRRT